MNDNVVIALCRLPADMRQLVTKEVRRLQPADAVALIERRYGGLLAPTFDGAAYTDIQQRQRAHREASRPGAMKGATSQRLRGVDPAGKRWRPVRTGPLDRTIFPVWGTVPVYVPPLVKHMNRVTLATVVVIGHEVDHGGRFVLPRASHARRVGCAPRKSYAALQLLAAAGLIVADILGNRGQATVWRYKAVKDVDQGKAARVLQAASARSTRRIEDKAS